MINRLFQQQHFKTTRFDLRVIKQDIIKCKTFAFLARAIVPNGRQLILYKIIKEI